MILLRDFAHAFLRLHDIAISFQDERLSTKAVEQEMIAADLTRQKRHLRRDALAATWILQSAWTVWIVYEDKRRYDYLSNNCPSDSNRPKRKVVQDDWTSHSILVKRRLTMNDLREQASAANLTGRHLLGIEGLPVLEIQALLARSSYFADILTGKTADAACPAFCAAYRWLTCFLKTPREPAFPLKWPPNIWAHRCLIFLFPAHLSKRARR